MSDTRAEAVPSTRWLLLNSAWMLATAIPNSLLAWLGFLVIGIMGRMPRWVVTGVVLGAAALLSALPVWGQWQPVARAVVYLGGMLLALMANPSWLRARWTQGGRAEDEGFRRAVRASAATPARTPAAERPSRRARARQRSAEKPAPQPAAPVSRLAEQAGASSASYFAAAPAIEPVDVNTADAAALAELTGLSRSRARKLVAQRDKQRGFASLDAFATAAGLQPHQLVRLRERATCSPPARGPRQFGRRVDY